MKNFLLFLLTLLIFQSCINSTSPESLADRIKKVENNLTHPVFIHGDSTWSIQERMEHYGVPGLSIAVIKDNEIDWVKTYGVMDKESRLPVTTQTLFQAGSISKPVAAYGALRLVEQNKISLDENVNTYLQSWKLPDNEFTEEKKVVLKHLLSHSAGITVHGFLGYNTDLPVPTLIEVLNGESPANSSAIFVNKTPEESFRYSGGGYSVMQQMMIDIEEKSFPLLMNDLVLQPLGMSNSTYMQPLQNKQLELAATGYLPNGSMTKGKRHTYPEMAAAGLWTTAEDLAKFAINIQQAVKGESNLILSKDLANKMLTPFVEDFIGLGIFINKMNDEIYFGHGGWDEGFSSELVAHKDKGYGVVILTNSNHPAFISELIRSVALSYQWDDYVPVYTKMKLNPAELDQISGRYRINNDDLIKVFVKDNKLFKINFGEDPVELFQISDSTYISRDNNQPIQFMTDPGNGQLNMVVLNGNNGTLKSTHSLMKEDEKLPIEILESGDFEQALIAYQKLMKSDPNDPVINENRLNRRGYNLLGKNKIGLAKDIFKININLYPDSANVYDSYGEACMENGDYDLAIANYKKSLTLESNNPNAVKMVEKMEKEKASRL